MEWQEKETTEFIERNKKHNHFESLGRTCNQTIVNLSAALFETLSRNIDTEEVIQKIKQNPNEKVALWNQLKVSFKSLHSAGKLKLKSFY